MSTLTTLLIVSSFIGEPDFSVGAIRESAPGICPPHGSTIAQLDRIIADYRLEAEDASKAPDKLAIEALRKAWPCRRISSM
jgi:hypothetical protein